MVRLARSGPISQFISRTDLVPQHYPKPPHHSTGSSDTQHLTSVDTGRHQSIHIKITRCTCGGRCELRPFVAMLSARSACTETCCRQGLWHCSDFGFVFHEKRRLNFIASHLWHLSAKSCTFSSFLKDLIRGFREVHGDIVHETIIMQQLITRLEIFVIFVITVGWNHYRDFRFSVTTKEGRYHWTIMTSH